MKPIASFADLIRQSSESIDKSTRIKQSAQKTISRSSVVIDRSRKLLFSGMVSGSPCLEPEAPQSTRATERPLPAAKEPGRAVNIDIATSPEQIADRDFVNEIVILDGKHFSNCNVTNCTLDYSGGPLILESTNFTGCSFRFGAEAAMTVAMLKCFGLMGEQNDGSVLPSRVPLKGSSRVN